MQSIRRTRGTSASTETAIPVLLQTPRLCSGSSRLISMRLLIPLGKSRDGKASLSMKWKSESLVRSFIKETVRVCRPKFGKAARVRVRRA